MSSRTTLFIMNQPEYTDLQLPPGLLSVFRFIAFFAMIKWLENFAYKTALSWWIFALSGLSAVIIALMTVSVQSWKASNSNPVEALRDE